MHSLNVLLQIATMIRLKRALVAYELSVSQIVLLHHVTLHGLLSETGILAMLAEVSLNFLMNCKYVVFQASFVKKCSAAKFTNIPYYIHFIPNLFMNFLDVKLHLCLKIRHIWTLVASEFFVS